VAGGPRRKSFSPRCRPRRRLSSSLFPSPRPLSEFWRFFLSALEHVRSHLVCIKEPFSYVLFFCSPIFSILGIPLAKGRGDSRRALDEMSPDPSPLSELARLKLEFPRVGFPCPPRYPVFSFPVVLCFFEEFQVLLGALSPRVFARQTAA